MGKAVNNFPDPKFAKQLERQFAKHGKKSILKSYESIHSRLMEHQVKLTKVKYISSVEREIRTFSKQLDTLEMFMKMQGIQR